MNVIHLFMVRVGGWSAERDIVDYRYYNVRVRLIFPLLVCAVTFSLKPYSYVKSVHIYAVSDNRV
jgi:hypothetical protein